MATISLQRTVPLEKAFDVAVVGGGPAGCAAAVAAARGGARTILLEQTGAPGGMGTQGLIPFWCPFSDGEKMIYRGIAEEVYRESGPEFDRVSGTRPDWSAIDAERLKRTYDRLLRESGVEVRFFSTVVDVENSSDSMMDVLIVASRAGLSAVRASVFIDATGDGDLAARAGVPFELGDANGKLQCSTLCFTLGNVDAYHFEHSNWRRRDCTWAKSPFSHKTVSEHFCVSLTGPDAAGFNAGHFDGFRSDDIPALSRGMAEGRQTAADTLADLRRHAPEVFGGARISASANLMGIREGRRIQGDYVLSWDDYRARRGFDDEIARNSYYIDIHGFDDEAMIQEIRAHAYRRGESHGIPYRSLLPVKLQNLLLAGRCIAADRIVYGSVRVMPVCLTTGEAAGTAAALAVYADGRVRNVNPKKLRETLKNNGAWLP